jgi:alpha-glucoside transport system permease protein
MGEAFVNSLAITVPATIIPILIAAFAAYAFSFMTFPGRDFLLILIVGLLVVPTQVALVPLLKFYGSIGINGTLPAVWLTHIGFGMPLAVYIIRNYMSTLPKEVIESAKIDGASHFQTFWRLILPMSTPVLASFAIFQFLWVWNDLLNALVFIGPGANQPLTIALVQLLGQQGQGWQLLTAGGLFTMLVPIIVFLSLQRYFVRGLTAGSVKG